MSPSIPNEGDRIELVHTEDPHTSLSPGDKGTVTGIDKLSASISPKNRQEVQIQVDWDAGSNLSLIWRKDDYHIINPE